MIIQKYRKYYDKLLELSVKFIENNCKFQGSIEKAISMELDGHFLNDYRFYAMTRGTKILASIVSMLEAGSYEEAIVLTRTMFECYLSERYFDEDFDVETQTEMITIPAGIISGNLIYNGDESVKSRDGELAFDYSPYNPSKLVLGKDKKYFNGFYSYLCTFAHCNFCQCYVYVDENLNFILGSEENSPVAHLFGLFTFSKLFENVVLLEAMQLGTPEEEYEYTDFFEELTIFLYNELDNPEYYATRVSSEEIFHSTFADMKNSLKEQLGRVDKSFVALLERQKTDAKRDEKQREILVDSDKPSSYFEANKDTPKGSKVYNTYVELFRLIDVPNASSEEDEKDAWSHTLKALDRAAAFRDKVSDPYSFMLLALTHDLAKYKCTVLDEDGSVSAPGHELECMAIADKFISRFSSNYLAKRYVMKMLPYHMSIQDAISDRSKPELLFRIFDSTPEPEDIIYFAMANHSLADDEISYLWDSYKAWKINNQSA